MNLKLFLVALTLFSIPSCTEDYSQYRETFFNGNCVQFSEVREELEGVKSEEWKNSPTKKSELLKQVREFYEDSLRDEVFQELQTNLPQDMNTPSIKKYDASLKGKVNNSKFSKNLSKQNRIERTKLLERLSFYKKNNGKIDRIIVLNTYLKLENLYFKMCRNELISEMSSDTVKVGKEYKMLLKSQHFNKNFEHLEYDSIQFLVDGVETKVDYSLKTIQEVGILEFTPQQVGIYTIKGERDIVLNSNTDKRIANPFFYKKNAQK